ncbi:hypothetical protein B1400_1029 [Bifidobacterium italicum]|uniref:Lipoprotein n=2 Tax=Bifidobacterium italicum TaxID=1960968 RepID=A0A2A2EK49_9BIFI|nr:hypothetical protein B1400_1029 [Bifidobacterium italicum]
MGRSMRVSVAAALLTAAVMTAGGCGTSEAQRNDATPPAASATATQGADEEYHVLPDYQVNRLKDELRDFPMEGKTIEFAGPVPSYTETNGARAPQTMQNRTELEFSANKSYTLVAMCAGEGGANVEWQLGVQFNRQHLECRPYSGTQYMNAGVADMGVTGIGADSSTVTITPDEGTKAEFAYRIDESDAPVPIVDDDATAKDATPQ